MKKKQDYINNFEEIDVDENEFDLVDEKFSELEKMKIKKNMRGRIEMERKNKRKSKIIPAVAGVAIVVVTSVPAVAKNVPFISYIYSKIGYDDNYSKYIDCIGKTVEHNGIKVTIEDIVGTKYKAAVTAKIEAETEADKERLDKILITCNFEDIKEDGTGFAAFGSGMRKVKGENGELLVLSESKNLLDNKEQGDLKITVDFGDGKCEVLDYRADFSKASRDIEEININQEIKQLGIKAVKMESDVLGSNLIVSGDFSEEKNNFNLSDDRIILKVGNSIYVPSGMSGNNSEKALEFSKDVYEKMKEELDKGIIPISAKGHNENIEYIGKELKEKNITYNEGINFKDGTKGEINKIEILDNAVKVYYKANTDKHSILMGTGMILQDANILSNKATLRAYNPIIYKDYEGGYIAEFNNVDTNTQLNLKYISNITNVDNTEIGEVIKID